MTGLRRWLAATSLAVLASFAGGYARATPFDSNIAQSLADTVTARPHPLRLPAAPSLAWQSRLQGNITLPPALSKRGELVIASTGRISQLGSHGRLAWTYRISGASAAAPPIIAPDRSRLLITTRGELLVLGESGRLIRRRQLPISISTPIVGPVMDRASTIILATGSTVILCDVDGRVLAQTSVSSNVVALAEFDQKVLVATRDGHLERWTPGVDVRRIGSFAGRISNLELFNSERAVALVNQERLEMLDLTRGEHRLQLGGGAVQFVGSPVVDSSGVTHVASADGLLLSYDTQGTETRRILLSPGLGTTTVTSSAHLLAGSHGRIAFALPTGDFGIVLRNGSISRADTAVCRSPLALVATARGRITVVCGSGLIVGFEGRPKSSTPHAGHGSS